jgi:hypothetical protein
MSYAPNNLVERLHVGWIPNDPLLDEAVKYLAKSGITVYAEMPFTKQVHVGSLHSVGSTLKFKYFDITVFKTFKYNPESAILWRVGLLSEDIEIKEFECSVEGLVKAFDYIKETKSKLS